MNNEQQQIIDEAYENYLKNFIKPICPPNLDVQPSYYDPMTKDWFVKSAKERNLRGEEFSEKWGLKIEEREFSLEERHELALPIWKEKYGPLADMMVPTNVDNAPYKIPRKLITLTYNNETIESYE